MAMGGVKDMISTGSYSTDLIQKTSIRSKHLQT